MSTPEKIYISPSNNSLWRTQAVPYAEVEYIRADLCAVPEWVSVAERLPELGGEPVAVWLGFDHNSARTAKEPVIPAFYGLLNLNGKKGFFNYSSSALLQNTRQEAQSFYTHWMPRLTPAPPSEAMPQGETDANK